MQSDQLVQAREKDSERVNRAENIILVHLDCDMIKVSLIYELFTGNFYKFYMPKSSCEINVKQSDSPFDFFSDFFGALFSKNLLLKKSFYNLVHKI